MPLILPEWVERPRKEITINLLTIWCDDHNIRIHEARLPGGLNGAYDHSRRTILIRPDLADCQYLAVLAHETIHAANQHQGHQSRYVESRIDQEVATKLVDPAEYAFWEEQYGWSTGGIASRLEHPRWVIKAYRKSLENRML